MENVGSVGDADTANGDSVGAVDAGPPLPSPMIHPDPDEVVWARLMDWTSQDKRSQSFQLTRATKGPPLEAVFVMAAQNLDSG